MFLLLCCYPVCLCWWIVLQVAVVDKDMGKLLLKYPWILSTSIRENYKEVLYFFNLEKVWYPTKSCLLVQPSFTKIMSFFFYMICFSWSNIIVYIHKHYSIACVSILKRDVICSVLYCSFAFALLMEVTWPSLGVLIPFKDITFIFFSFLSFGK